HSVADPLSTLSPYTTLFRSDQNQFRLRHSPLRVLANADCAARRHDFFRQRFEENFRARGVINLVVRRRAEIRFLHARLFTPLIRDWKSTRLNSNHEWISYSV